MIRRVHRMKPHGGMIVFAAAALAASFSAFAQGREIGFVDVDRVFQESRAGQQSKSELDKEAAGYSRELEQVNETARKLQEDLDRNALTLSERDRAERQRRIGELKARFDRRKETFTEEFGQHRGQAIADMLKRVEKVVAKIAERDQLELVVNRAVTVDASIDITDKVIRGLDDTLPDSPDRK